VSQFNERAKEWDQLDRRVLGAQKIAQAIKEKIVLEKSMEILDFGVGTGLLGFEIAASVQQVYGVDTAEGMLKKLQEKNSKNKDKKIIPIHQDIIKVPLKQKFDGIISSMTLHHIEDIEAFFHTAYKLLKHNGFLALADLQSENGTFHSDNTTVHHFGFSEKELYTTALQAGFTAPTIEKIHTITKPHGDFGVFLLTARR